MSLSQLPPGVAANTGNNKTLEFIIGKAFLEAERTCTSPWVLTQATTLPGVPITFKELMTILAAVACILNCACALYLITGHVNCWVRPDEQRQILRIIVWDVVFSMTAFFSIYFYVAQKFLHPFADYYEGFAMTAIFLMYVFLMIWILVFQVTFTRIATYVAQETLYATTCPLSTVRSRGSIAIQVVQGVSTAITVYAIILFERRMHKHMSNNGHRPLLKLVSFKLIVGLEAMQNILFSALGDSGVYFPKPPYHVSWADFTIGIPQFVLILEMTVTSIVFLWSFSFEEYKRLAIQGNPIVSPAWKAFLQIYDVRDIGQGVLYMFTAFTKSQYLEGSVDGRRVDGLSENTGTGDEPGASKFENKVEND